MRWLLLKDLQILWRSPLQTVLLVVYPILIAVLVGFAISPDSGKPRVAFLNEVPSGTRVEVGARQLDSIGVSDRICKEVECIDVKDRDEAVDEVESGDALAALIIPADLVDEINSLSTLAPGKPRVEVLVNEENPLKSQAVDDKIDALLAQANLVIAKRVATEGGKYLDLLNNGGEFSVLGASIEILGLKTTGAILEAVRPSVPAGTQREALDRVIRFSTLARENLSVAGPLIQRLAQPIEVEKEVINGSSPPLDVFAIAVAAALTLAFVTVLLVAGSLALEREENAFPRLTRSLVSPTSLLAEKVLLGVAVGLLVTLLMLGGLALFVPLAWDRFGLWLLAILFAATALGAAGAALGAAAREVRAVSLLAFMLTLPIAFLSLVPSGAVGKTAFDAIGIVVAVFPFKPALDALSGALDPAGPSLGGPLLHLAILAVAYGLLARLALRRFTAV